MSLRVTAVNGGPTGPLSPAVGLSGFSIALISRHETQRNNIQAHMGIDNGSLGEMFVISQDVSDLCIHETINNNQHTEFFTPTYTVPEDQWILIGVSSTASDYEAYVWEIGDLSSAPRATITRSYTIPINIAFNTLRLATSRRFEAFIGSFGGLKIWEGVQLSQQALHSELNRMVPGNTDGLIFRNPFSDRDDADILLDWTSYGNDLVEQQTNQIADDPPIPWGTRAARPRVSAAVPPAGDISASLDLTLTQTQALLTGQGALSSGQTLNLTTTGATLTGVGALASSGQTLEVEVTEAGASGVGSLSAPLTLNLTQTQALLTAIGKLTADQTLTLDQTQALLTGIGALSAGQTLELTITEANLTDADTLSADLTLDLTQQATLVGDGALSAGLSMDLTITEARLGAPGDITASLDMTLTQTGALLTGRGELSSAQVLSLSITEAGLVGEGFADGSASMTMHLIFTVETGERNPVLVGYAVARAGILGHAVAPVGITGKAIAGG